MGTVHLLQARAVSPERLRQRFDSALIALDPSREGTSQLALVRISASRRVEMPWEMAGRLADDALRQSMLLWLSCMRQQLRFFCLIP